MTGRSSYYIIRTSRKSPNTLQHATKKLRTSRTRIDDTKRVIVLRVRLPKATKQIVAALSLASYLAHFECAGRAAAEVQKTYV